MSEKVIAIGASSGGLKALTQVLAELPAEFDVPIVAAIHSLPSAKLIVPLGLSREIELKVKEVEDGEVLRGGWVYTAPGATHVLFSKGGIKLSEVVRDSGFRPSIDALFMTLATEFGTGGTAVVLSGTMNDGMRGAQVLYDLGGTTVVQDPEDAAYAEMPQNVIAADHPRRVLTASEIGIWLRETM